MWNRFGLEGKQVVICGAGQGIGAACARVVRGLGGEVICVDRDLALAEAIAHELGGTAVAVDLTTEAGVVELGRAVAGRVDGLVDIVGMAERRPIGDLDPATWDQQFDVNLRHAYLLGREFGPRMADQGTGSIVSVASIVSGYGTHITPAYHATKAALLSWVKSLAVTYGPQGVRANAVSPGVVLTARMEAHWKASGTSMGQVVKTTALKQLAEPEDVADAVAFLSSPAARMITGQTIVVDAGTSVRDPFYGDPVDESLV